jgi:Uma2 family endonuclease
LFNYGIITHKWNKTYNPKEKKFVGNEKKYIFAKKFNHLKYDCVMKTLVLDINKRYTYADYLTWADDKMRELIDGFVKMMSAPGTKHQRASVKLSTRFVTLIESNSGACEVFAAPFDVRLPKNGEMADKDIYTVVQPDICVVCDVSKLDEKGCLGAPDLVVEIQSYTTARYDLTQKYDLYETSGVREYWMVYPFEQAVEVFLLQPDGKFGEGKKYKQEKIPVHIFEGCEIDLTTIF